MSPIMTFRQVPLVVIHTMVGAIAQVNASLSEVRTLTAHISIMVRPHLVYLDSSTLLATTATISDRPAARKAHVCGVKGADDGTCVV